MSTTAVEEIIKRANVLTKEERMDVIKRLTERKAQPKFKKNGKKGYVSPNTIWMRDRSGSYGGKYVALENGELVATGKGYPDTLANARRAGAVRPLITYVPREDEELFGGW